MDRSEMIFCEAKLHGRHAGEIVAGALSTNSARHSVSESNFPNFATNSWRSHLRLPDIRFEVRWCRYAATE